MPKSIDGITLRPQSDMWKYALKANDHVLFTPWPKQLHVMQEAQSGKYANIFVYGNRGGGKSHMARAFAHGMAMGFPGFKYVMLRTAFPDLTKNHLVFLPNEMEKMGGTYNKTEHIAYYPNGSFGFYMQCADLDDVNKAVGAEAALVVFDEAPMFEWEHMVMIGASLRADRRAPYNILALYLGNPTGQSIDQLYAYCIDKDVQDEDDPQYKADDWHAIRLDLLDNPTIDAEQYIKRFSGLPAHIRRAWVEGERTLERTLFRLQKTKEVTVPDVATGEMVVIDRPYHVIDELPTFQGESILDQSWVRIYGSYDHGFIDPAVCLWFAVFGRRIICFKESVWHETHADEIARDIMWESAGLRFRGVFCDPKIDVEDGSVESIKESMERQKVSICSVHGTVKGVCCQKAEGLKLRMDCAVNDRELFADVIHRALNEEAEPGVPRIQFLSGDPTRRAKLKNGHSIAMTGCPYLLKSLPKMRWADKNPKKLDDHRHDHPVVALAYYIMNFVGTTKPVEAQAPVNPYLKEALLGAQSPRYVLGTESVKSR